MGKKGKRSHSESFAATHGQPSMANTSDSAKKRLKQEKRKQAAENQPSFNFVLGGFRNGRMVTIKDLRELTLSLCSAAAPNSGGLGWIQVNNQFNVDKVVTLFIPGITQASLALQPLQTGQSTPQPLNARLDSAQPCLPVFSQLFSHYAPTKAAGDRYHLHSVMQTFITVPMSDKDKQKRDIERQKEFDSVADPTVFLLQPEALVESLYMPPSYSKHLSIHTPIQSLERSNPPLSEWYPPTGSDLPHGWMQTPQYVLPDHAIKCLAVDCEMVKTSLGQELARITIVNRKLQVIYDSYVQPSAQVLDYATQWSGITPEDLRGVTTSLADVQKKLTSLVDYKTILVGHSLENDLRAVKLAHPWVIDTALIYQHTRGPPFKPSLKWLASKWLDKAIQVPNRQTDDGVAIGHDSKEDAQTAMELLNLKMIKGPLFGEFVSDQEVLFERIAKPPASKTSAVVDHGSPGQWHGAKATQSVSCTHDAEVLQGIFDSLPTHDYIFARFLNLSHALGWSSPSSSVQQAKADAPSTTETAPEQTTEDDDGDQQKRAKKAYDELNEHIRTLYQALPPRTALIIFSGHGDPRRMGELLSKKNKFDRLWKTVQPEQIAAEDKFMTAEDRELQEQVEKAKAGMAFFACK